jgi:predicted house-cleaning noncanonical NTP pyrophosphatase (MazG superfamily)
MRLPIIKHIVEFIENNDEDYIIETLDVLESLAQARGIKEEELVVIGELMSNMYGALEVRKDIQSGIDKKEALNSFMKRVTF